MAINRNIQPIMVHYEPDRIWLEIDVTSLIADVIDSQKEKEGYTND